MKVIPWSTHVQAGAWAFAESRSVGEASVGEASVSEAGGSCAGSLVRSFRPLSTELYCDSLQVNAK